MPSSVIRSFDCRPDRGELDILFTIGRRDVYRHVPSAVVSALAVARGKGRYFNARIRDRFHYSERPRKTPRAGRG